MIDYGKLNFRNKLIKRLNENANRYQFIQCGQGIEMFEVDEVINRVYDGISEDDGRVD